ncbi:MAG: hypothetical protein JNL43_09485 [Flavobacteriales bacterium]|nr:hypothetical protein [Flavobacteriales bacterium]HRH68138.1 hypothetical protein [Flavobacteriales bacterium]
MNPWKRPFLFPIYFILAVLLFGGVVMLLWNAIIPGLTGWAAISFPKALGLLVLCRILFGGFHGKGGHGGPSWKHRAEWRERWKTMNDEQRAEMRQRWRERCGPRFGRTPDQE